MGNHRVIESRQSPGNTNGTSAPAVSRAVETVPEASRSKCIFSVDVEDWFHILDLPSTPPISDWDNLPSRVEQNFLKLLDIFSEKKASVTCFFLGWVAERFPYLVKEAAKRGHEIASHGYAHRLAYQMTRQEFLDDATKSKRIIEDAAGLSVSGYRSAGFSVT